MDKSEKKQIAGHLLVECLVNQGVTHAFGVPGESFLAVLDGFHAPNIIGREQGITWGYGFHPRRTIALQRNLFKLAIGFFVHLKSTKQCLDSGVTDF
jgi:hypothetical protein